jgi:hypothetical protein
MQTIHSLYKLDTAQRTATAHCVQHASQPLAKQQHTRTHALLSLTSTALAVM